MQSSIALHASSAGGRIGNWSVAIPCGYLAQVPKDAMDSTLLYSLVAAVDSPQEVDALEAVYKLGSRRDKRAFAISSECCRVS